MAFLVLGSWHDTPGMIWEDGKSPASKGLVVRLAFMEEDVQTVKTRQAGIQVVSSLMVEEL